MALTTLRQIKNLCKFARKACKATNRSRSPFCFGQRGSTAASNTPIPRSRWQLWRKRQDGPLATPDAPLPATASSIAAKPSKATLPKTSINDDENAFLDFDGTQAAADIDISLRPQSQTALPKFVSPMPDRLPKAYELIKTLDGDLGHFRNPIHLVRRRSSGKQFIVKQVPLAYEQDCPTAEDPMKEPLEDFSEVFILQDLDHENIISIESVHLDYNGPFCVGNIVLQYCDGGDVSDFVASVGKKHMPVQFVQHFVSSMLDALLFLHHGQTYNTETEQIQHQDHHVPVFHRDIKERNIFLDKSNPASNGLPKLLLADFGLASTNPMNTGASGTEGYIAPELIYGSLDDISSSSSSSSADQILQATAGDWYAFGVTLYQIMTGKQYTFKPAEMSRADLSATSSCKEKEIIQLVLDCLRGDPELRPQAEDSLRLHRLSAKLKAELQSWHDEGGRLPDDIWPEAFRFERVGRDADASSRGKRSSDIKSVAEVVVLPPATPQKAPVAPVPYVDAMQSPSWSEPTVGLRRRIAPRRVMA